MSLPDLLSFVFFILGGGGAAIGIHLKLAEQWLKDKNDQVDNLVDAKRFAFMESLNESCKKRSEMEEENEEEFPLIGFGSLYESVGELTRLAEEFDAVNGCLFQLSRIVRDGAKYWLFAAITLCIGSFLVYIDEFLRTIWSFEILSIALIIAYPLFVITFLFAMFAVRTLIITLNKLNRLDEQSEELQRYERQWRKRT